MDYAIIRLGGKQYRVREGETLVVDRLKTGEGATITPDILLGADGATVTARIVAHERGPKIRIGKYKKRTGYKRHAGHRSAVTRIQIESIGTATKKTATKAATKAAEPKAAEPKVAAPKAAEAVADAPASLPDGYADLTVARIQEAGKSWSSAELAAALAYEQGHAKRKGALAALETLIAKEGEG